MIRKKFGKKEIFLGLLIGIAVTLILTAYIWHQAESYRLGITARELESEVQLLKKEIQTLEVKKAQLLRLERVKRIAEEKLNLAKVENKQINNINDDKK
jgi:cell division protein FtsL